jgi:hypothetical protein
MDMTQGEEKKRWKREIGSEIVTEEIKKGTISWEVTPCKSTDIPSKCL